MRNLILISTITLGALVGIAYANISSSVTLSGNDFTNGVSALYQNNSLNLNAIYNVMGVPQGATVRDLTFNPQLNQARVDFTIIDQTNNSTNGM